MMSQPYFKIQRIQYLYAALAGCVGIILIVVLMATLGGDREETAQEKPLEETKITTAGQRVNSQEVWVARIESENKLTQEKINALEKLILTSINEKAKSKTFKATSLEEDPRERDPREGDPLEDDS